MTLFPLRHVPVFTSTFFLCQVFCQSGLGLDRLSPPAFHHPHQLPPDGQGRPGPAAAEHTACGHGHLVYVGTAVFANIEHYTGSCYQSPALEGVRKEHQSKQQCHGEGGFWHGFDISGHSFLLTFCVLMIVEEMAVLHELRTDRSHWLHAAITTLGVALGLLTFIWVWMFLCTAVYFHNLSQKVFGTLFGLLGWYGTYTGVGI